MSRLNSLGTIVMVLSSLWFAGCQTTSAGEKDRQAADAAAARARVNESEFADAVKKALNERLDEVQHRIDGLKADSRPVSAKARRELDERVKALQDQVGELRLKLSNAQGRDQEWSRVKRDVENALQKIESKLEELARPKK
jgi:predicted  nucleic acid-binding Zn-ribbon protein